MLATGSGKVAAGSCTHTTSGCMLAERNVMFAGAYLLVSVKCFWAEGIFFFPAGSVLKQKARSGAGLRFCCYFPLAF